MGATSRSGYENGFSWAALTHKKASRGIRPVKKKEQEAARTTEEEEGKKEEEAGEEEKEGSDEEDGPCIEEAEIKIARNPGNPNAEEIEKHNVMGHLPYRPWCSVCVEAKGKEMAHKRGHEPGDKPQVGLDYKSFGQEADRDDKTTMIVLKDRESRAMFTHICLCKGPNDVWIVDQLVSDINGMGHTEVVVKTDGEPALVKLMEAVQEKRKHPSIPMHPPAYDPQSNGAIEKGVGDSMGQIRAIKIGLERRIKARIGAEWPIMQWIVEYAGVTLTWFQVGHDGRTAHRRLREKIQASQWWSSVSRFWPSPCVAHSPIEKGH